MSRAPAFSSNRRWTARAAPLALALALGACGGGSGSSGPDRGASSAARSAPAFGAHGPRRGLSERSDAPGYYVDAVSGDDAAAGSADAPFRTLARLAALRLQPGQGLYLHCGDTWRESLVLDDVQLADDSFVAAYGTDCDLHPPRITGADDFSGGWSRDGTGVWSRDLPAGTPKVARLFVDGMAMRTAQWPNDNGGSTILASTASTMAPSTTSLTLSPTDLAALAGQDLQGAGVLAKTQAWDIEPTTVAGFAAGVVSFTRPTQYPVQPLGGYALQDKLWMVDAPGEFFHDVAANKLYLKPPQSVDQAGLNGSLVEGAVRDHAISLGARARLSLSGLQADMARTDGIVLADAPDATVTGVTSAHHGRSGLRLTARTPFSGAERGATIVGATIADNPLFGIDGAFANRVTLRASTVSDTGTIGWIGSTFAAVSLGEGGVVDGNAILRSAYIAVRYSGTAGSVVNDNDITGYCLRLSDCGAIYTWNGPKDGSNTVDQSSSVTSNRIGAAAALDSYPIAGVYLDEHTMGARVVGNTVAGSPYGVFVQNASDNLVDSNRLWLNTQAALWASATESDMDSLARNVFSNNQLAPVGSTSGVFPALPRFAPAYAIQFWTVLPDLGSLTSGSNRFVDNEIVPLQSGSPPTVLTRTSLGTTVYSPGQWSRLAPGNRWRTPATFDILDADLDAEGVANGDFSRGLKNWKTWFATPDGGSAVVGNGLPGCTMQCALFTGYGDLDLLYGQAMPLRADSLYVAKVTAAFDTATAIVPPYITLAVAPYSALFGSDGEVSASLFSGESGDVLNTQSYFHASVNAYARVNLKVFTPGATVRFDNVSVRRVRSYALPRAGDWAAAVLAPRAQAVTVTCASLGWPATCAALSASGEAVALPATVGPGATALLLRADSPLRR